MVFEAECKYKKQLQQGQNHPGPFPTTGVDLAAGKDRTVIVERDAEQRVFMHTCGLCKRRWESIKKADRCPECRHWHIAMSSFIE